MLGVCLLWNEQDLEDVYRTEDGAKRSAEKSALRRSDRKIDHDNLEWREFRGFMLEPNGRGDEYLVIVLPDGDYEWTGYSVEWRNWL